MSWIVAWRNAFSSSVDHCVLPLRSQHQTILQLWVVQKSNRRVYLVEVEDVVVVGPMRSMALVEGHKMLGTPLPMSHRASEVPPMNYPMFDPMQVLEAEEAPMSELIRVGNSHMSSSEHLLVDHLKTLASWVAVFGM